MTDRQPVSITSDNGFTANVSLGGVEIGGTLSAVRLDLDARNDHHLTLTLRAFPLLVDLAEVRAEVDEETHDLLVHLGWTPPAEKEATG